MIKTNWPFTEQGYVDAPGGKIWYGVVGDRSTRQTPLMIIHGGPGLSHDYLYPLTDLADEWPLVFYDQLDAGLSERPNDPANWNLARFLAEIDVLREQLDLTRISIFGNSWGGTLAAAYGASQPHGLEKLILSGPLINTERWITDNAAYRASLPEDVLATMNECEAAGTTDSQVYEDAVSVFYRRHLCRTNPWPSYVNETFETLNIECYSAMWGPNEFTCNGVLSGYDGSPGLAFIEVPTLLTCGEFDEATPTSCGVFAGMISNSELAEFAKTSHFAFVEDRAGYSARVREFLRTRLK